MFKVFYEIDELFNEMIKINNNNPSWANNKKNCSIPISNKYFLTIFDDVNTDIQNFFEYINDNTRTIDYPFKKENNIDYSFMIEQEQFYNIDLTNSTLNEISSNLDSFYQIINESNGDIIFVLDINCLIDNFIISKEKLIPNHLIDFIMCKIKNKVSSVYILDLKTNIKNHQNMLYLQLESCLKNFLNTKYNLEKKIFVYKDVEESAFENIYWNLLYPEIPISESIQKINSPIGNKIFDIVMINKKKCFICEINLIESINKNLLNLNNEPGIIIDPTDRLNISISI